MAHDESARSLRGEAPASPQVIAHRGASKAAPENTLEAFLLAGSLGAHGVELDARRTADGVIVVHHDAELADGRVIVETDAAELPASVPSLAAALDACAGMWVNIEIKNNLGDPDHDPTQIVARAVMRHLAERGEPHRWLISSFDMDTIDTCRAIDPQIRTAYLCIEPPDDAASLMVRKGHAALHPWWPTVTADLVAVCHDSGVQVNVWTVDEVDDLAALAGLGVDGLCTNVPDVALRVLHDV